MRQTRSGLQALASRQSWRTQSRLVSGPMCRSARWTMHRPSSAGSSSGTARTVSRTEGWAVPQAVPQAPRARLAAGAPVQKAADAMPSCRKRLRPGLAGPAAWRDGVRERGRLRRASQQRRRPASRQSARRPSRMKAQKRAAWGLSSQAGMSGPERLPKSPRWMACICEAARMRTQRAALAGQGSQRAPRT